MTALTMLILGFACLASAFSILIGNPWALPMEISFGTGTIVAQIEGTLNGE